jgi:predicted Zn-dependent peptidase
VVLIDKKGAAQTMVLVARPIFGRGSADEFPMTITNEIFGGSFSSRLNMNLREDKGYTYGAGSQTAYRAGVGVFLAYGAMRQDATAPALKEIFSELTGMETKAPAADEVERAKDSIQRSLPGAFERTGAIAGAASSIFLYDLPLDYFVHLSSRYEKITPADVQLMTKKWLTPDLMQVLLVGDAAAVSEGVRGLNLGKLQVRSIPN